MNAQKTQKTPSTQYTFRDLKKRAWDEGELRFALLREMFLSGACVVVFDTQEAIAIQALIDKGLAKGVIVTPGTLRVRLTQKGRGVCEMISFVGA